MHRFLYLHDAFQEVEGLRQALAAQGLLGEVLWVTGREAFQSALEGELGYDLIFADYAHPGLPGSQALALARARFPETPLLFLCQCQDEPAALADLEEGAADCLVNPGPVRLGHAVRQALKGARQAAALREAQATATRAAAVLQATLATTSEGILVVDLAGKVAAYNRRLLALCGLPEEVMAPMQLEGVLQFLLDQFEDPEAFLSEARLLRTQTDREGTGLLSARLSAKSGQILEGRKTSTRLDDQAKGSVFSFRDVTDREKVSAGLRLVLAGHQKLLKAASVGGAVPWCLEGDQLILSEFADSLLGAGTEGPPKQRAALEALLHPEDLDAFHQALQEPRGARFDARLRRADGRWFWARWSLERTSAGGYRGVLVDDTEARFRAEAHLDRCRRAHHGDLAAGVAKVVGAKVQKLRNRLGLLEGSHPLTEAQGRHLGAIGKTLESLESLMRTLDGPAPEPAAPAMPVQLNGLVERLRPRVEAILGLGIVLQVELGPDLPALTTSATHLEEIILALVFNARDALRGSGQIRLRTGRLDSAPGLFLEVQDDGPGLSSLARERLFQPFFTTKEQGNGLGLWAARRSLEREGGSLRMEPAEAGGVRFRLEWPTQAPAAAQPGQRLGKALGLGLPLLLLALAGPLQAQEPDAKWQLSGFGTLGLMATDTHQARFLRDVGQPYPGAGDRLNPKVDSRLGLQLKVHCSETLSATLQTVSKYQYDATFKPALTWAFLNWNPTSNLQVRAGRLGLGQILGTDTRDVGYSYLWVRPNGDLFAGTSLNLIDGLDVTHSFSVSGQHTLRLKAFGGEGFEKAPLGNGPPFSFAGTRVFGLNAELRSAHWLTRLAYSQARIGNSWPGVVSDLLGVLDGYAVALQDPRLARTARLLDAKGSVQKVWAASFLYEEGPIQSQGILARQLGDRPTMPDSWSGYLSFGYRLGEVMPYGVLSRTTSGQTTTPELGILPLLTDPTSLVVVQAVHQLLFLRQSRQSTLTAGLRWDFADNAAFKFQVDRSQASPSAVMWTILDPAWNGKATVFSLTLDFVFGWGR